MKRRILYWLGMTAELGPAVCIALAHITACIDKLFFSNELETPEWLVIPIVTLVPLAIIGLRLVVLSIDRNDPASRRKGHYGTLMVLLNAPILYFPVLAYDIVNHRVHIEIINQSCETFDTVLIRDDHHSFTLGRFDDDTPVLSRYIAPYTFWMGHASWKNPVLELRRGSQTHVQRIRYLYRGERVMILTPDLDFITTFTTDDPATFHH